jgi:hypothetical protein
MDHRECSLIRPAKDTLNGVAININAVLIMDTLFGFDLGNYYRCVSL